MSRHEPRRATDDGGFVESTAAVIEEPHRTWSGADLALETTRFAARLADLGTAVFATLLDNSAAWIVADLAAARAGVVHVPLPPFFTPQQITHALASAGVDTILAEAPVVRRLFGGVEHGIEVAGRELAIARQAGDAVHMPEATAKITFTSGTTGTPKGVCLTAQVMGEAADALALVMEPLMISRHLCALPMSVLLENVAGIMAPLGRGATCVTPPMAELGLVGSSSFDPARFDATVRTARPHSLILLPQMLRAWTGWLAMQRQRAPDSLRMVAVGGAAVGAKLILAARALGIPAYEGYGLSEGASVQTLNLPGADRPGSAGRPLPHVRLRVTGDGEIEVAGALFSGYLGDPSVVPDWWPTGDLGEIDPDGFVHLRGRRKQVLITAFGRNVSPEWVETALRGEAPIAQAVVFGDAQPALSAVLWPVRADATGAVLQAAVDAANATLPDYARVGRWVRGRAAFSADTGLATPNGRPRRREILDLHAESLGLPPRCTEGTSS